MNLPYIDTIARSIYEVVEGTDAVPTVADLALYRIYAVLCLVVGADVTNEHVHDAWSAWRAATKPDHESLIPFDQLSPTVQELDTPYRDAIRAVARAGLAERGS